MHTLCILISLFAIPLDLINTVSFSEIYELKWKGIIYFILIVFGFDILLSFNIGTYNDGIILKSRKEIAKVYIQR